MKIGISGAQGTGKSTLLDALRSGGNLSDHEYCVETTRWVQSIGFDINEAGSDMTQLMIMYRHIEVMNKPDFVTDRTVVDGLVYTEWLYNQGRVSKLVYDYARIVFDREIPRFDYLFFIQPEFDLVGDGVRSTSIEWRDQINARMTEVIESLNIPVTYLTGSVDDRVQQFLNTIAGYTR
jgi:nicotinamide riboside kinase